MYQHIMVPLDGSELAECVFTHLDAIAAGCYVKKVTLISVEEPLHIYGGLESMFSDHEREQLEESRMVKDRSYLDGIAKRLNYKGAVVETKVLRGHVCRDELEKHPDTNKPKCLDPEEYGKDNEDKEAPDSCIAKPHQVTAHYTRDSTRCADHRR